MKIFRALWNISVFRTFINFIKAYWGILVVVSLFFFLILNPMLNQCTRHEARFYSTPYGMNVSSDESLLLDEVKDNPWITTPKWTTRSWFKYPKVYDVVNDRAKKFERRQDSIRDVKERKTNETFEEYYKQNYEAEEVEEPVVPKPKEIDTAKQKKVYKL